MTNLTVDQMITQATELQGKGIDAIANALLEAYSQGKIDGIQSMDDYLKGNL